MEHKQNRTVMDAYLHVLEQVEVNQLGQKRKVITGLDKQINILEVSVV